MKLKICGLTRPQDATMLIELGVAALGVNFWPNSKRFIEPKLASPWLKEISGKILRVGVFVDADPHLPQFLIENDIIDLAQFHGNESPEYCQQFAKAKLPFIKAFGIANAFSLRRISEFHTQNVLLDAPAGKEHGGTGTTFDWNLAELFRRRNPEINLFLAGGITSKNAAEAANFVRPTFLDIASGSESKPGIKERGLIEEILHAIS